MPYPAHRPRSTGRAEFGLRHGLVVGAVIVVAAALVSAAVAVPDSPSRGRGAETQAGQRWAVSDDATEERLQAIRQARAEADAAPKGFSVLSNVQEGTAEYVRWRVGWLREEIARIDALDRPTEDDVAARAEHARELARLAH